MANQGSPFMSNQTPPGSPLVKSMSLVWKSSPNETRVQMPSKRTHMRSLSAEDSRSIQSSESPVLPMVSTAKSDQPTDKV
jgi:hypothetical protein